MRRSTRLVCTTLILLASAWPSGAQDKPSSVTEAAKPPAPQQKVPPAQKYFTDVLLTNQDGEHMHLYSDLLKGKVVVINVFFSTCHGSCPVMMGTLSRVQDWLGDRLGKQVHIISLSVDPEMDSPAKLKEYAQQLKARKGWYFISGEKKNVDLALSKLGQYVQVKEDHSNIMIIGNETTGLWKKAFGLAKAEDIIKIVESVLNDKE